MFDNLTDTLRKATALTGAGRLMEATAAIQRMLGGQAGAPQAPASGKGGPPTIDGVAEPAAAPAGTPPGTPPGTPLGTPLGRMPDALRGLRAKVPLRDLVRRKASTSSPSMTVPVGAQFLAGTFTNDAGTRPYKLYVPSGYSAGQPVPLLVMLHGCTQSPDDFAAGTGMNDVAEAQGCLVVYPGQIQSANMQKCWNWFSEADQGRDAGEPSLIAGITRQVVRDYAIDARRVFVAGLSAGGAAAAIMGHAYPELFAAVGVHSGLPCGAAHDMPSAFAAMRQGATGTRTSNTVPTIVFHGDSDPTVSPRNGDAIVVQAAGTAVLRARVEPGQVPGGRGYGRTVHADANGRTVIEQWVVQGAGHAWSGGRSAGSYTDPQGPDASAEMMRFFLQTSAG